MVDVISIRAILKLTLVEPFFKVVILDFLGDAVKVNVELINTSVNREMAIILHHAVVRFKVVKVISIDGYIITMPCIDIAVSVESNVS